MEIINVCIDNLYFDANNYRLKSNLRYKEVDEKAALSPVIQNRTFELITGGQKKRYPLIRDLTESMKINGFLKVDNILVKKFDDGRYIILEGNRRLAALKVLKEEHESEFDLDQFDKKIFETPKNEKDNSKGVEVVLAEYKNQNEYLVLMGLKHVSGNKKWDTYNQAKLLAHLRSSGYSTLQIARKIGLQTTTQVELLIRAYHSIQSFIEYVSESNISSDYSPYDKFRIFIELMYKPKLRDWIGWNDEKNEYINNKNMNRFFSWIVPRSILDEENEEDLEYKPAPPIIDNHKQLRKLADLLTKENFLIEMENIGDFDIALESDAEYSQVQFSENLRKIEAVMNKINLKNIENLNNEDKEILDRIINRAKTMIIFHNE